MTGTATPAPTAEPYQRVGYAITIGDGAYVRDWPSYYSVILAELPGNKVVYVHGQTYVDGVAWHEVQYDETNWGYIRADMLRMMSSGEIISYLNEYNATPQPTVNVTVAPYNGNSLSSYGYVSSNTVNFRKQASTSSERIGQLKKYAFCLVLGTEEVSGVTWYKVSYNGKTGYISGDYFKQLTLTEMEDFLKSPEYTQGIQNNASTGTEGSGSSSAQTGTGSSGTTTTTSSGTVVSAEDARVSTWVNPNSTVTASYEPFDPFATPEPLDENTPQNTEYLDSLAERVRTGTLTEEGLDTTLRVAYKDAENAEELIENAKAYIKKKLEESGEAEATETPEASPLVTEAVEYPQEENSGGSAVWWILAVVVLAAGGGGYAWYINQQKKRRTAQQAAQKRAAQAQRKQQAAGGQNPKTGAGQARVNAGQNRPGTAGQNGNRPGTGSASQAGGTAAKTAARNRNGERSGEDRNGRKPYGKTMENPYARYTSGTEEDSAYTASYKPADRETETGSARSTSYKPSEAGTDLDSGSSAFESPSGTEKGTPRRRNRSERHSGERKEE